MSRGKAMVISHTVVFLLGVTAAKLYDYDELNSYRHSYEKPMQKFRRWSGHAAIGTVALGSLWLTIKLVARGGKRSGCDNSSNSKTIV
jgi:hypothetical protein